MVILLKQHTPQAEQERLLAWLRELGAEVRVTGTPERPFFCLTGDISRIDPSLAARFPAVEDGSPAGQGRGRLPAARRGIQAAHLSL